MPTYYTILTDAGQILLADAIASGQPVVLTQFAVGDGGGVPVVPDAGMDALVNEVYRGNISALGISPEQPNAMMAQLIIPKESGGYTVREVGLFSENGTLFSIGNYPDQPKPPMESGYAVKLDMRYVLVVSDASAITVVIPPGDYLTEPQADTLYLRQDKHLFEIAEQGEEAQQTSRDNLRLGSAAIYDYEDFLPSGYTAPVTSVNTKTGAVQLNAGDVGAFTKEESDARYLQTASGVTGIRMASYLDTYANLRDSSHRVMTGIYENNGYDNPTNHESRVLQYSVAGAWYDVPYV